jgi:hypothetical protein
MDTVFLLILTIAALLTIVYTTPGGIIIGLKLRLAVCNAYLGMFYLALAAGCLSDVFQVNAENFSSYIDGYLVFCWVVILVPYSATTKAIRTQIQEQIDRIRNP